ncbi:MAG TPA: cellulase family glycosylhydrolase [Acidobacteriaceae bacterium]|nr:cellulase family glycosylhydrolase [Acidobacteriaceae bacterium]
MSKLACTLAALLVLAGFATAQTATPPLHTSGTRILDSHNRPVQLRSVNWYGFDQKEFVAGGLDHSSLDTIAGLIGQMGFNSVRLPWANETVEHNPIVADSALTANPQFHGKHSLDIMDAVIAALTRRHIMVILDNHMSDADWCCSEQDENGLWYNARYPESAWLADWKFMVRRYAGNPWVIGADLRNELRSGAAWGGSDPKLDWHAAAERGGNAVLSANPKLLIFIEGPRYSTSFSAFPGLPVHLSRPDRAVISPHAYSIGHSYKSYDEAATALDREFTPLLTAPNPTPIWVGEFGQCTMGRCEAYGNQWVSWFAQWANEHHVWNTSWWALNATESSGRSRTLGEPETYGLLTLDWKHVRSPQIITVIDSIHPDDATSADARERTSR